MIDLTARWQLVGVIVARITGHVEESLQEQGAPVLRPSSRARRLLGSLARRRAILGASALSFYALAALAIFGRGVVGSLGSKVVGDAGADKTIFMWSFRWWPHALVHGHDAFNANLVWVPHGIDLAWATSVPLLSVASAPLTAAVGPIAAYNIAALAGLALSAWTAYLLARYLTRSFWPSLLAGWIFGFSAFEIGQMISHLNLVFLPFVPLCALLALKHLNGGVTNRRFVILLALVLTAQFLTSTEIFLDVLIVGALFLASAALLVPEFRGTVRKTMLSAVAATALACVLVSPYLWHAFVVAGTKSAPVRAPFTESADLLNFVVPTHLIWLQLPGSRSIARHFTATGAERGAYLGLPLLVIVVLFLWTRRQSRVMRAVALAFAATFVAALGAWIRIAGHRTLPAPWRVLSTLPLSKTLLPIRLTLFVALIAALILAAWLAEGARGLGWWRWALAILAIVFLFPNPTNRIWSSQAPNPTFFKSTAYKHQIRRGATILVFPFGGAGWSLLWQAEDGFSYRLVGGHLGRKVTPAEERWSAVYLAFGTGPPIAKLESRFRSFLKAHNVSAVVVAPHTNFRARRLITGLGVAPIRVGDVLVYRLSQTQFGS